MCPRAVICDFYQTIAGIGPPRFDPAQSWTSLLHNTWPSPPNLSLAAFDTQTRLLIDREHAAAKAAGIPHPEIFWPGIAAQVLPELAALSAPARDNFLYQHARLARSLTLMPGAADTLFWLTAQGIPLGIASNSQPYTLRELTDLLQPAGLALSCFQPDLCFFSFQAGFSKPDPHVFRLLSIRLLARGIYPPEILMVGDRPDNDIAPANSQGWQTWLLASDSSHSSSPNQGNWFRLLDFLREKGE